MRTGMSALRLSERKFAQRKCPADQAGIVRYTKTLRKWIRPFEIFPDMSYL